MCPVLVHTQGGGQHAASHQWDARRFKDPLDRPIFTVLSVQDWKGGVQINFFDSAALQYQQRALPAAGRYKSRGTVLGRVPGVRCNLLYLLTAGQPAGAGLEVETTQGELAELLGLSRVQFTRGLSELRSRKTVSTSRGRIQVTDLAALAELCTSEVL